MLFRPPGNFIALRNHVLFECNTHQEGLAIIMVTMVVMLIIMVVTCYYGYYGYGCFGDLGA